MHRNREFNFKRGYFERIEESLGLDLGIYSLIIHKLAFWHHFNDEINNTRQETTHDEDQILGAGPPSNGICIMNLNNLFYNIVVLYTCMHSDMKGLSNYLHPLCRGWKNPCCRPQSQPQWQTLLNPKFVWCIQATSKPLALLQSLFQTSFGALQIALKRERNKQIETMSLVLQQKLQFPIDSTFVRRNHHPFKPPLNLQKSILDQELGFVEHKEETKSHTQRLGS